VLSLKFYKIIRYKTSHPLPFVSVCTVVAVKDRLLCRYSGLRGYNSRLCGCCSRLRGCCSRLRGCSSISSKPQEVSVRGSHFRESGGARARARIRYKSGTQPTRLPWFLTALVNLHDLTANV
jgi:hypothetical protein